MVLFLCGHSANSLAFEDSRKCDARRSKAFDLADPTTEKAEQRVLMGRLRGGRACNHRPTCLSSSSANASPASFRLLSTPPFQRAVFLFLSSERVRLSKELDLGIARTRERRINSRVGLPLLSCYFWFHTSVVRIDQERRVFCGWKLMKCCKFSKLLSLALICRWIMLTEWR